MRRTTWFFWIFLLVGFGTVFGLNHRILVGSPIRQKPAILTEFLASLKRLEQKNYTLDYYFIDDNDDNDSKELLRQFAKDMGQRCRLIKPMTADSTPYVCDGETHHWKDELVWKVADYKDRVIESARDN